MQVLVTRPSAEASELVESLCALGFPATALPLIGVDSAPQPQALQQAWRALDRVDAVMFVSGNAVRHFFAARALGDSAWSANSARAVRAWVTGPGSAAALRRVGVAANLIDAPDADSVQFDSEALWQQVQTQVHPGFRLLIVRGAEQGDANDGIGRDWLGTQVRAAGGVVDYVVAYVRTLPPWSADLAELARRAASDGSVWLFSSGQAVRNLALLCPTQGWGAACAVVTHSRIAQVAHALGFGQVRESRPSVAALVASIESLQ